MFVAFDWSDVPVDERGTIVDKFLRDGIVWARGVDVEPSRRHPREFEMNGKHVGDDMLIVDMGSDIMWTGDWGSSHQMKAKLDYVDEIHNLNF